MAVEIGKMDKRVKFENPTKTPDGAGGQTESFVEWLTTWGFVKQVSGFRNFTDGYTTSATRFDVFVYWRQAMSNSLLKETRLIIDNLICTIESRIVIYVGGKKLFHFTVIGKY